MGNIDRIVNVAGGFVVLVCVGVMVWIGVRNPMEVRMADMEAGLGRIETVDEPSYSASGANLSEVARGIIGAESLWSELVAPPKRVVKAAAGPDMESLLRDVVPSARDQIGSGADIKIKFRTNEDASGKWFGIGDKMRGATIESIDDKSVVFMMKGKGKANTKEYRHTLKRR